MRWASVCSGIGAPEAAWSDLFGPPAFVAEIDRFASDVLRHRLPASVPNLGDFTKIEGWHEPIDLLVGGTPCQSFSVAGKRAGLDDPRGNLTLEFFALARRLRARWFLWENVPGVLSDDEGRTFAAIVGIVAECGYAAAWRVLDAQYFGVPQRRRRLFLVGHLGDGAAPWAVLLEPSSMRGDPPPRRQEGKGIAPTISARTRSGGGLGTDFDCDGGLVAPLNDLDGASHALSSSPTMTGRLDPFGETLVAHTLTADGFDASEDGSGRGPPLIPILEAGKRTGSGGEGRNGCGIGGDGDPMFTLQAGAQHAVAFNITPSQSNKDYNARASERSQAVTSNGNRPSARGGDVIVAQAFDARQSDVIQYGDKTGPLDTDGYSIAVAFAQNQREEVREIGGGVARACSAIRRGDAKCETLIAFSCKDHGADAGDVAPTLRAMEFDGSHANAGGQIAVAVTISDGEARLGETMGTLDAARESRGSSQQRAVMVSDPLTVGANPTSGTRAEMCTEGAAVRRLTPRECERLQGFPDDYTLVPLTTNGKPNGRWSKNGPRYKSLGNSMAVPVIRWIGRRILWADEAVQAKERDDAAQEGKLEQDDLAERRHAAA